MRVRRHFPPRDVLLEAVSPSTHTFPFLPRDPFLGIPDPNGWEGVQLHPGRAPRTPSRPKRRGRENGVQLEMEGAGGNAPLGVRLEGGGGG
eukprot:scaffold287_cov337-Pavlova_lutheri.AAC.177